MGRGGTARAFAVLAAALLTAGCITDGEASPLCKGARSQGASVGSVSVERSCNACVRLLAFVGQEELCIERRDFALTENAAVRLPAGTANYPRLHGRDDDWRLCASLPANTTGLACACCLAQGADVMYVSGPSPGCVQVSGARQEARLLREDEYLDRGRCRVIGEAGGASGRASAGSRPPKKLPSFAALSAAYLTGENEAVKDAIGGEVDVDWVENVCTVKMSRAFNYAGQPIPEGYLYADQSKRKVLNTLRGADGLGYAYRVDELEQYLREAYGPPGLSRLNPGDGGALPAEFVGRKGVIVFKVSTRIWDDATGHADLWDGYTCKSRCRFDLAREVYLWVTPE